MKKVIAVFVVHAKDIFSTLGKFHCNRHNYYYGHRELKIEKDITSKQEELLLTQLTESR